MEYFLVRRLLIVLLRMLFTFVPKASKKRRRRVAFCLVENDTGQVLLIQRGYGKQKGKW